MRSDSPKQNPRPDIRLQKYLASCGVASRRHCETLIASGDVSVNGRVVTELGSRVCPLSDRIAVKGRRVEPEPPVYFMVHKPAGYLCTNRDPRGRPTFLDLLPRVSGRVYSVGRLDGASEGLLLVTNDGDLAHRLMHPAHRKRKHYRVQITHAPSAENVRKCLHGMDIEGVPMRMESCRILSSRTKGIWCEVVLLEGRNRQIRRMFGAQGIGVIRLIRTGFGPLRLGSLPPGKARPLTEGERAALRNN